MHIVFTDGGLIIAPFSPLDSLAECRRGVAGSSRDLEYNQGRYETGSPMLNRRSVQSRCNLSLPYSDIVAVMIFEHQMRMMNLITPPAGRPASRLMLRRCGKPPGSFVDYLFFVDEAPLSARIQGTSGFAEKFAAMGPRDSKGRSLRQFDLERRSCVIHAAT